ncbi:MAG: methyltransferase domain-containing protein [Ilumatobacter sp.]|nr:methyltransferase domain-containing protein [Ilumatobacter sp.]
MSDHHEHHHGHANDQGLKGALRYLRWLPQMWRSEINDAVVAEAQIRPGERVVDIGAGLGAGATRAAATGAHVIAVEPTPFMRRILRARQVVGRHRDLEVVDGTAERMPVADHSVDVVVAVNTMHHWVDVDRGVAEVARVLRAGGRVLLVDEDFDDPTHPEHERFSSEHDADHHGFTMVDAAGMRERMQAVGLQNVDAANVRLADRPVIRVSATA